MDEPATVDRPGPFVSVGRRQARRISWTLLLLSYPVVLAWLWRRNDGFTLTSADDATRLLIADSFRRYGVAPLHWTWPPLPMALDALLIPDGGDLLLRAVVARAGLILATALLLARFWTRAFDGRRRLPGAALCIAALWLYSPLDVRLALSGLSEPYLYALVAVGLCCWQCAADPAIRESRSRIPWLCAAGAAFGLSTWCRYEGGLPALLLAADCAARGFARLRSRTPERGRAAAAELAPALVMLVFPLAWLAVQHVAFGDALAFLKQTRAVIREEALAFHGRESLPLSRVRDALLGLWSAPVASLAAVGLVRLAVGSPRVLAGLACLVVLYGGMAAVGFGGRAEFYLNLFGLAVAPLAVKGAEGIVHAAMVAWSRATRCPRARALQAGGVLLGVAVLSQVVLTDLPSLAGRPLGDWLLPAHRNLFARLRAMDEEERALVILDPGRMSAVDHPWDNIALQLAAPSRVVVVPFDHVLVPKGFPKTGWLPSPALRHAVDEGAMDRTGSRALDAFGFTQVLRDADTGVRTARRD